jgi:hypothetical protein
MPDLRGADRGHGRPKFAQRPRWCSALVLSDPARPVTPPGVGRSRAVAKFSANIAIGDAHKWRGLPSASTCLQTSRKPLWRSGERWACHGCAETARRCADRLSAHRAIASVTAVMNNILAGAVSACSKIHRQGFRVPSSAIDPG